MRWYLDGLDYERHNAEVEEVWAAYRSRTPVRVPVILGINPRIWLLNPALNAQGIGFRDYSEDPDVMARTQLESAHYIRHNMLQDAEMGIPKDGWAIWVDLQNYYDASWLGAPVEYRDGQVPDTRPILTDDNKRMLFDRGIPDPFTGGIMAKAWRFYEHMNTHKSEYVHSGVAVGSVSMVGLGCDGIMTNAANLRGATEFCLDMYEDPGYAHELLDYLTDAFIQRIMAFRKALGQELKPQSSGLADDSIELLSVEAYREFVLPRHKRFMAAIAGQGPHSIHLCGNVQRHMSVIKSELNVNAWDAGFPVDLAAARAELGPDFQIATGPRISLLAGGTPDEVMAESRRMLESGIMEGGRFILRDANNVAPRTSADNIAAMYHAAKSYGLYP
jgi:uroporphyrinogen-III decarboxylase